MYSDIKGKLKKGNKILFSRDSRCLQNLIRLIELQKHRTIVMWAFECAQIPLELFEEKYPAESRPGIALEICKAWAKGEVKMPVAKKAILDAHATAKDINDDVYIALCHAIGHAGATVHVETHALGLVFYELTAIVLANDKNGEKDFDLVKDSKSGKDDFTLAKDSKNCNNDFALAINEKIDYYYERLQYWQNAIDTLDLPWAKFLLDDTRPNKEKLLNGKNWKTSR